MPKTFYIKTFGCQNNEADSEIVSGILAENGFEFVEDFEKADIILLNTCSVREKAENTLRTRLNDFKKYKGSKIIGILGCMAERIGPQLLEDFAYVNFCIGPDEYHKLLLAIDDASKGKRNVFTKLSLTETYEDCLPKRIHSNGVSAFVSIMRGCNNMCSYCIVPFTRGRERSRRNTSILQEVKVLSEQNFKEITLLGQNVNSYRFEDITFAKLLEQVAEVDSTIRIRFTSPHPKDFPREVLDVIAKHKNICNSIHLPLQAGSDTVLERMNRPYTREQYLDKVAEIRDVLGADCGLSTDIMVGFCGETEEDHEQTLDMMEKVKYDLAYMFAYSEREGTRAATTMDDDVPYETKMRRLNEVIALQRKHALERNKLDVGKVLEVLVEGKAKKSEGQLMGRTESNKVVVFDDHQNLITPGMFVKLKISDCSSATLLGTLR